MSNKYCRAYERAFRQCPCVTQCDECRLPRFYAVAIAFVDGTTTADQYRIYDKHNNNKFCAIMCWSEFYKEYLPHWHDAGYWSTNTRDWKDAINQARAESMVYNNK